jgi:hypothetical protein
MKMHIDEKGKYFTEVISKDAYAVIVQTTTHRIRGIFYVRAGARLKDELNNSDDFVAITDAEVFDSSGKFVLRSRFLSLSRSQIVWLIPEIEVQDMDGPSGGGL